MYPSLPPIMPQRDSVRNFFQKELPKRQNIVLKWYPLILCSSVISTFVSAVQELLKAGVSEGFLIRLVIMVLLAYVLKLWVNNRELSHQLRHRPVEMENLEIQNEVLTRIFDRLDPKTVAKETGYLINTDKDPAKEEDQVDS